MQGPPPRKTCHPVILNAMHNVSLLVILYYHLQSQCAGDVQVLHILRQHYLLLKGVHVVRKVFYSCCTRRRRRSQPTPPIIMADLPPSHTLEWTTLAQSL